ncbi:Glycine rich protein [Clostridioides difficile]|nr:Glycine rich protein [Clostridioides difficile]
MGTYYSMYGGGATDIRLVGGAWDNEQGLLSRIIVAGGGGGSYSPYTGGAGGGLAGGTGYSANDRHRPGGTQYQGGIGRVSTENGSFGKGCSAKDSTGEGGGGGWFGGAGMNGVGAGGGGSGYILTKDSYKPTGYTPTSEYYFDNVVMESGGNTAGAYGYALITLLQALPFLTVSSYNSTTATFKADHTDPALLTKIEYFIDDVLKETITTDLTLEKTINYTLEDNALHTLKIVVTDSNNATAEKVLSISKNIMPLPENVNLNDISTKLTEVNAGFKTGKTSIINTLALKNIEASLNNTLVELSEKIKTSFDSSDASVQDLMNQLTQSNNTITQLNTKYQYFSGVTTLIGNSICIANFYGKASGMYPGYWIRVGGFKSVPNIFIAECEYIYDGKFYKHLIFASCGVFTKDFTIRLCFSREIDVNTFSVKGDIFNIEEQDVWYNTNLGLNLPAYNTNIPVNFNWCAIKFK